RGPAPRSQPRPPSHLTVPARALREAPRTLLGLAGGDRLQATLVLSTRGALEAERPLVQEASPVGAQRDLGKRGDLPRQRPRRSQRRAWLDNALHQADAERLLRVHRPAGEDQVERAPLPDHAR